MKRFAALILALTLVLSAVPADAFAVSFEQPEGVSDAEFDAAQPEQESESTEPEAPAPEAPVFDDHFDDPEADLAVPEEIAEPDSNLLGMSSLSPTVLLPLDNVVRPYAENYAQDIYYVPAGASSAQVSVPLPYEMTGNNAVRVFATDSFGNTVASTYPGDSSRYTLYFARKTSANEMFTLRAYGGDLANPHAYIVGTLKTVDGPIVSEAYFNGLSEGATTCEVIVRFYNLSGSPESDYKISVVNPDTSEVYATSDQNSFRSISDYNGLASVGYALTFNTPYSYSMNCSVKVERADGGVLYSSASSVSKSAYMAAVKAGVNAAAVTENLSIVSAEVDSANSSLHIQLAGYDTATEYNVNVSESLLGINYIGYLTPDENGVITVPISWAGENIGLAESSTYYIYVFGNYGMYASYTKYPDAVGSLPQEYNSGYGSIIKRSEGEYYMTISGSNKAVKAVYDEENPVLTLKRVNYSSTGQILSVTPVNATITVESKNDQNYNGNLWWAYSSTYSIVCNITSSEDLAAASSQTYEIYMQDKMVCMAYLTNYTGEYPAQTMRANGNFLTGIRRYVNLNGYNAYQNIFWSALDQIGINITTTYGGENITVNVRNSEGEVVMSKASKGKEPDDDSGYIYAADVYIHNVFFTREEFSKLVPEERYSVDVSDGTTAMTIIYDAEYSAEKTVPTGLSITSINNLSANITEFEVSAQSSMSSYMFGGSGGLRNYTVDDLKNLPVKLIRMSDGANIPIEVVIKQDDDGRNVPYIKFSQPLAFGKFRYYYNGSSYQSIDIADPPKPYIGYQSGITTTDAGLVELVNCSNLPDGPYYGYITYVNYSTNEYIWAKVEVTHEGDTLRFYVPEDMRHLDQSAGSFNVAIFGNGKYLSCVWIRLTESGGYNPQPSPTVPYEMVAASISVRSADSADYVYSAYGTGVSIVDSPNVIISISAASNMAYYRMAESDDDLISAPYSSLDLRNLTDFGDTMRITQRNYTLKNASGWNNLYFQFKTEDGQESCVLPYSVLVTDEIGKEAEITKAEIEPSLIDEEGYLILNTSQWPSIPIHVHTTTRLLSINSIFAVFGEGGSQYTYSLYPSKGSLAKCQEHENCYTVIYAIQSSTLMSTMNSVGQELNMLRIAYYGSRNSSINYYDIPVKVRPIEVPDESKYLALESTYIYTRTGAELTGGGAIPGSTVTIDFSRRSSSEIICSLTTSADKDGVFTFKVPTALEESSETYAAKLSCALGENTRGQNANATFELRIDNTAPEIIRCAAVKNGGDGEDGSVISCEFNESNYYVFATLKRTDGKTEKVLVDGEEFDSYPGFRYVDTEPVSDSTSYVLFLIDRAGNKSSEITFACSDVIPPEAPTNLCTTSVFTGHVTLSWDAAADNVGVEKYYIYRRLSYDYYDDIPVGEIGADHLSWTDTEAQPGAYYYYCVAAVDAAGNISDHSDQVYVRTGSYSCRFNFDHMVYEAYVSDPEKLVIDGNIKINAYDVTTDYDFSLAKVWLDFHALGDENWDSTLLEVSDESPDLRPFRLDFTKHLPGEYEYRVHAVDACGVEYESDCYTLSILDDVTPPSLTLRNPQYPVTLGPKSKLNISLSAYDDAALKDLTASATVNGEDPIALDSFCTELSGRSFSDTVTFDMAEFEKAGVKLMTGDQIVLTLLVRDAAGNDASCYIDITVDATAPGKVTNVTVLSASKDICLEWTHSSGMEPGYYYNVYRSDSQDGEFTLVGSSQWFLTYPMKTNYYCDSSLTEAGTYYYYVTAVGDYDNESEPSDVVSGEFAADMTSPEIVSFTPEEGSNAVRSVDLKAAASDNYKLASAVFEYQQDDASGWTKLSDKILIPEESRGTDYTFVYSWDISDFETGIYNVRVSVYDQSSEDKHTVDGAAANAPATEIHSINIIKYNVPEKPIAGIETTNSTAALRWAYTGEIKTIEKFEIRCCETSDGEFRLFKTVAPDTFSYNFKLDGTMYYRVAAVDIYGEEGVSDAVIAVPKESDTFKPEAVITPEELIGAVGEPIEMSAALSRDNTAVTGYHWEFGDGSTAEGVEVSHIYNSEGDYNVVLTVSDAAGNESKAFATAKAVDIGDVGSGHVRLNLTVVDGAREGNIPVPGATLIFHSNDSSIADKTYVADENGTVSLILKRSLYAVSCTADGYSPISKTLNLTSCLGTIDQLYAISSGSLVTGELRSSEMTMDEIIQAGIDYSDPENQHIEKFKIELRFDESIDLKYEIDFGYKNVTTGEFTPAKGGFLKGITLPGGGLLGTFPISEHFMLVVYGNTHWLKEMYKVELLVINSNTVEHLEDVKAELCLPSGLSLAAMSGENQSAEQIIKMIGSDSSDIFTWYVRGDAEGAYYLTANINAMSVNGALSQEISKTFTTDSPIHVYSDSAFMMTIHAPNIAMRGKDYVLTVDIQNMTNKTLYDFDLEIENVEQYKIINSTDILLDASGESGSVHVSEFGPGGVVSIEVSTQIMFNGINELLVRLSPLSYVFDPVYVLTNVTKLTLAGSTTSIPYNVVIDKVEKVNLLEGTPFDGLVKFFGIEEVRGYPLDFDLVETGIEIYGLVYKVPMLSETVTMMELMDTEGEYSYRISVKEGSAGANSVSDGTVSLESADTDKSYIDPVTGELVMECGGLKLSALKAGDSTITVTAIPSDPEAEQREYTVDISVSDGEVKTSVEMISAGSETVFADSSKAAAALEDLTEQAKNEMRNNQFEWFDSVYSLESESADAHVGLKEEDLEKVAERAFVTHIGIESENAEMRLDRGVIDQISSGGDMSVDMVKLSESEISERFGEDYKNAPTYEIKLHSGDKEITALNGKAEISIPYQFAEGESETSAAVLHISGDTVEQLDFEYKDGKIVFETDGFSCFRIIKTAGLIPNVKPVITGGIYIGGKLSASVEGVNDGELIYKWYRGDDFDDPIAEGSSYALTAEDSENTLTVRAYGTGSPYSEDLYISAEIEIPDLEKTFMKGDVNGSGEVTLDDAIITLKTAMNVDVGSDTFIAGAADLVQDGNITLEDAIAILKIAMSVEG